MQAFNELVGTMFWFLLANAATEPSAWVAGVTYVVVRACMCACSEAESVHLFTPYTLYKIAEMKNLDPLKGVFWILMQFLGTYLGNLLLGAMNFKAFSYTGLGEEWNWAVGFKFFFGTMFALHVFTMANSDRDIGIENSFFLIFGFAVLNWFGVATCNFAYHFGDTSSIGSIWITFVWTLIAVVVFWAKIRFLVPAKE